MTTTPRLRYYVWSWARNLLSCRAYTEAAAAFGSLWLCVQILTYFLPERQDDWLQARWWLFLAVGLTAAIWRRKPRLSFTHNITDRDVTVEIAVGDVFDYRDALIVGSNTTFDTEVSEKLISEESVQGAFTRKHCQSVSKLDAAIETELAGLPYTRLEGQRIGKSRRYPVGTTVRVEQGGRIAYFLAIANINRHGVARGDLAGLTEALASLWWYVGDRGGREELVAPVLGSGFGRFVQRRDLIVREMVRSFIAACSERVFTQRLTIVLSPEDVLNHRISLDALNAFVEHVCLYPGFASSDTDRIGSAVPEPS
ncbi:MAG: DUF6430 domain-containing protein [Chloroflexi bacterium]|nr:DUF6430 domain-containing protein [Chloroflexota bacterium]